MCGIIRVIPWQIINSSPTKELRFPNRGGCNSLYPLLWPHPWDNWIIAFEDAFLDSDKLLTKCSFNCFLLGVVHLCRKRNMLRRQELMGFWLQTVILQMTKWWSVWSRMIQRERWTFLQDLFWQKTGKKWVKYFFFNADTTACTLQKIVLKLRSRSQALVIGWVTKSQTETSIRNIV